MFVSSTKMLNLTAVSVVSVTYSLIKNWAVWGWLYFLCCAKPANEGGDWL